MNSGDTVLTSCLVTSFVININSQNHHCRRQNYVLPNGLVIFGPDLAGDFATHPGPPSKCIFAALKTHNYKLEST